MTTKQSPVLEAIEEIGEHIESFRKKSDEQIAALDERLDILESLGDRPTASIGGKYTAQDNEHKEVFLDFVRNPSSATAKSRLEEANREMDSKAVNIGTDVRGGFALLVEIANEVELRVTLLNPFRQIVRVVQAGSSDYAHLVSKNNPSNSWVAEDGTRTETTTSDLVQRKPTFGTCYSLPKVSEEALADIFFDVQAWLVREVSDNFAAAEAEAIVSGNGTARPTGFLNTTPVTTVAGSSPEAAAGALTYIPMDSSSPQALHVDDIIDLVATIPDGYLDNSGNCAFVMRRATAAVLRKVKSSTGGDYLWQPSTQAGMPDMLAGYPVYFTNAMQAYVADAHPIAFGNWNRGYLLADRGDLRLTVDDNISTKGQVLYYIRRRIGGCILNRDSLAVLKYADS